MLTAYSVPKKVYAWPLEEFKGGFLDPEKAGPELQVAMDHFVLVGDTVHYHLSDGGTFPLEGPGLVIWNPLLKKAGFMSFEAFKSEYNVAEESK